MNKWLRYGLVFFLSASVSLLVRLSLGEYEQSKPTPIPPPKSAEQDFYKMEFVTGFGLYIEAGKDVFKATNPNDYTVKWSLPNGTWTATWKKD